MQREETWQRDTLQILLQSEQKAPYDLFPLWRRNHTERQQYKRFLAIDNASQRTIMIASVDAMHTRAESAEGKGETIVGAKEIATWLKKERNTRVKHAAKTAA